MTTGFASFTHLSRSIALAAMLLLSGCDAFTDAATRLAYDLEGAARQLKAHGDRFTLHHKTPSVVVN